MKLKQTHNIYVTCSLVGLTTFSAFVLSRITTFATASSVTDPVSISVASACTFSSDGGSYSGTVIGGNSIELVGDSITTICNDVSGYSLYAIGYSGDSYDTNNTKMLSSLGSNYDISTNTSGTSSYWAMKVNPVSGNNPTITNSFDSYHNIPAEYTQVATYNSTTTSGSTGSSVIPTYKIYASADQPAGSYTGKIKYTLVHPNDAPAPTPPPTLYETVAAMSKGTQTAADLQATITVPTSSDPSQDTSNSGVYEYDSNEFGTSSDASNDYKIYYYRGVLENSVGSYGSDGSAVTYPNYVILDPDGTVTTEDTSDTCWRIVRTTGSGGVKMVYNGEWTGSTCANATTSAQVITSAFNDSSASNGYTSLGTLNIHAVGYTYNSAVNGVTSASADTTIAKVFGTSTNNGYTVNSSDSIIKQYIEKTWFTDISAYQGILETSAGYCNDRTVYPSGSYALSNKLAEDTQIVPYGTSGMTVYYFGAYTRNMNTAQAPTLNCPRGTVDLYSVSGASTGNGQLTKPASLLTADELSFAGSGRSTASQGSSYNANSFLRSGSYFWLLSPFGRTSDGSAFEFRLGSNGTLGNNNVGITNGVRPAISLTSGTTAASGSGTATDPWVVTAP